MSVKNWEEVGTIVVDAGVCWIGDPCYVLHDSEPNLAIGKNWQEFCELIGDANTKQFGNGVGVCVSTGYGDGEYPVYVSRNSEGRITEVLVVFIDDDA
jgi:hypothetical protein